MTFCFCFLAPKVKNDGDNAAPAAKHHARREKEQPIKTNDPLAAPLLKASKKGCDSVLQATKELRKSSRQWTTGTLDAATVRARASALSCCVDTLLAPLLEAVESAVGRPGQGGEAGWEGLQLSDVTQMCKAASVPATSLPMQRVASGVAALLGVLLQLRDKAPDALGHGTAFHNQSTNKLVGMASVILSRQVTHEAQSVWQDRLEAWRELEEALLGLKEGSSKAPALAASLRPPNKALLAYLRGAAHRGERKATLKVRRGSALWDAAALLRKLGLTRQQTGPTKVFPQFRNDETGAVEAGEGHGPRKEFFLAAGEGMIKAPEAGSGSQQQQQHQAPFTYSRSAGQYFFNQMLNDTPNNRDLLWASGWLAAQTVCNRSTLGVPLPEMLFRLLLEGDAFKPTLELLAEFDPDAANALKNVNRLSKADFDAMLQLEECEGMSREQYVRHGVAAAMCMGGDTAWVFENFRDGFWSSLSSDDLDELRVNSEELMEMVCGMEAVQGGSSSQFSVQQVFRIVLDEELGGDGSGDKDEATAAPLAKALWEVVDTWPVETKRQFVVFVTGSDRLPLPGTELLRVELPFVALSARDHKKMLGMLPQAHTCENLLELPNYWEALMRTDHPDASEASELTSKDSKKLYKKMTKILDERLQLAITSCTSYGLDEGVGDTSEESQGTRSRLPRPNRPAGASGSGPPPGPGIPLRRQDSGGSISSSEGDAAPIVPFSGSRSTTRNEEADWRGENPGSSMSLSEKPSESSIGAPSGSGHLLLGQPRRSRDGPRFGGREELGPLRPLRDPKPAGLAVDHLGIPPDRLSPSVLSPAAVLGGNMRQGKNFNSMNPDRPVPGPLGQPSGAGRQDPGEMLLLSASPWQSTNNGKKAQQIPKLQNHEINLPGMMSNEKLPQTSNQSAGKQMSGTDVRSGTLDDLLDEFDLLN